MSTKSYYKSVLAEPHQEQAQLDRMYTKYEILILTNITHHNRMIIIHFESYFEYSEFASETIIN